MADIIPQIQYFFHLSGTIQGETSILGDMIIVHDIFVCKPGNASKAAKLWKEMMANDPHVVDIMTDITGQYHRVILVSRYESLAEYEQSLKEYLNPSPEMQKMIKGMADFRDMYLTGSREIYRTW